jgi:hypothetical protein
VHTTSTDETSEGLVVDALDEAASISTVPFFRFSRQSLLHVDSLKVLAHIRYALTAKDEFVNKIRKRIERANDEKGSTR